MKKATSNNFQCINISNETYTGKEMSPKGLGYSAVGYDIGFEKEGVDKQIWVVQLKNSKKVWFRKNGMFKVSHEEPLITLNNINSVNNINIEKKENIEDKIEIETIKKEENKKKITDFQIFYSYYSNKLKEENKEKSLNKTPKLIQEETYIEWNRLKKNKVELNELLLLIKNKR